MNDDGWTDDDLDAEARRRAGLTGNPSTWTPQEYAALVRELLAMAHEDAATTRALAAEADRRYGGGSP